ncbi:MAG TPA: hypothetical protein VLB68_26880 [Pyrinomonadaceae bacterium]|nr:hypothetical protein [Pyrinomonadaceae bacterium]
MNITQHYSRFINALMTLVFRSSVVLIVTLSAQAHPLGNFTINHFTKINVGDDKIKLRYVIDMAEIPSFQEFQRITRTGTTRPTQSQLDQYAADASQQYANDLSIIIDGSKVPLQVLGTNATLVDAAGGLQTLRLESEFAAVFESQRSPVHQLQFTDNNLADRLGWRELVVSADVGISVFDSTAYGNGISDELRKYPDDMLTAPLNERDMTLSFSSTSVQPRARGLTLRDGRPVNTTKRDRLIELIAVPTLTPGVALTSLLVAFLLGGLHALSPGHGKTIVGAYLVGSRGTAKHAAFLGLTVTITHTLGVFALGVATLLASEYIVPGRLFPILSLISGALVVVIGANLLLRRFRAAYSDGHQHGHELSHAHDQSDHTQPHSHGGLTHSHLPPGANGDAVTWRSLLALGISGGILPCPSALVVLLAAISLHRVGYGLLLVVAFSAGLASSLTIVGLAFVYGSRFVKSTGKFERLSIIVPMLSALVVTGIGLVICYSALDQAGVDFFATLQKIGREITSAETEETSLKNLGSLGMLGLGLIFGLKHATEVDHIVAVSAIVSQERKLSRAALVGAVWGLGHTFSLLAVGVIVLVLKVSIPDLVASWLEFAVALMIVGLGTTALIRSLDGRSRVHVHQHDHRVGPHSHLHFHDSDETTSEISTHSHSIKRLGLKPAIVGAIHGLAGSAALTLLVLSQISSLMLGLLYLFVFGLGSIVGMLLMSGLMGLPFLFSSHKLGGFHHGLQVVAGALSIVFGLWYAYVTGFGAGLFRLPG